MAREFIYAHLFVQNYSFVPPECLKCILREMFKYVYKVSLNLIILNYKLINTIKGYFGTKVLCDI